MSTMIERVARAMRRKYNIEIFDRDEDDGWEFSRDQAVAAIAAMREPLEVMTTAGAQKAAGFASAGNRMCNGYRAMIDAALKETA